MTFGPFGVGRHDGKGVMVPGAVVVPGAFVVPVGGGAEVGGAELVVAGVVVVAVRAQVEADIPPGDDLVEERGAAARSA